MTQELVKVEQPSLPECWDYDESVEKVKGFIYKWKNLTIGIAQELWIARERLSAQGKRTDLETKVSKLQTWTQYCEDIGHSRMVVNRWLNRFFPPELPGFLPKSIIIKGNGCVTKQDAFEFLNSFDDESVDLLLTDPPYITEFESEEEFEKFVKSWVPLALSKIKNTGRAYIFTGAYPEEAYIYLSILKEEKRFISTETLIWFYRNRVGAQPKMMYKSTYQNIFYLYGEKAKPLNFPSEWSLEHIDVQDINAPDARHEVYYHAHQKPDEIARRFIEHGTEEGNLIIDPFAGTGTFIITALSLGRDALGSERDDKMFKIYERRMRTNNE